MQKGDVVSLQPSGRIGRIALALEDSCYVEWEDGTAGYVAWAVVEMVQSFLGGCSDDEWLQHKIARALPARLRR